MCDKLKLFEDLVPLQGDGGHEGNLIAIAGPCSAESLEHILCTAHALKNAGIGIFRAGIWKPRTSPDSYSGPGKAGLEWLVKVKAETGMCVATEVATPEHVNDALDAGIDFLWIGARTTANPFAVQEIADRLAERHAQSVGVLVKNPVNPDLELWIGALQRIYNAGIRRIAAVHRGFSTFGRHLYRNDPQWQIPIELKRRINNLPIICDPSHMGGRSELIAPLSQQALDMGFDGLMIECHCCPQSALSDKEQQITPDELHRVLEGLIVRRRNSSSIDLEELRRQIDRCDDELLDVLSRRMDLCRRIGALKKSQNITVVQPRRYDEILERRKAQAQELGIDPMFVQVVMQDIHQEAVRTQVAILQDEKRATRCDIPKKD